MFLQYSVAFFLEGVKIIPKGLESQDMTAFFFLPELLTTKGLYVPSNKENTYGESAT